MILKISRTCTLRSCYSFSLFSSHAGASQSIFTESCLFPFTYRISITFQGTLLVFILLNHGCTSQSRYHERLFNFKSIQLIKSSGLILRFMIFHLLPFLSDKSKREMNEHLENVRTWILKMLSGIDSECENLQWYRHIRCREPRTHGWYRPQPQIALFRNSPVHSAASCLIINFVTDLFSHTVYRLHQARYRNPRSSN